MDILLEFDFIQYGWNDNDNAILWCQIINYWIMLVFELYLNTFATGSICI